MIDTSTTNTKSFFLDKTRIRQTVAEQNEKMDFVRVPGATAQTAREMIKVQAFAPKTTKRRTS